jgi:hypothetical protein
VLPRRALCLPAVALTAAVLLGLAPGVAGGATVISTVAGNGVTGFSGDGGLARNATFNQPIGLSTISGGGLLVADSNNQRIRKIDAKGIITTVAGSGPAGAGNGQFAGDNGPATAARLNTPNGVSATADGGFLIADSGNNRIRKVDPDGTIHTVAGVGGNGGFNGDNIASGTAQLNSPTDVGALSPSGYLIADTFNHRVRKVDGDGPLDTITTVAGNGTPGLSGDNGPATSAQLNRPVSVLPGNNLFAIADSLNHRVRMVGNGTITTIAGSVQGYSGDGGAPTDATLDTPTGVAVLGFAFLIVDSRNHAIRIIPPSNPLKIQTLAGNGLAGFTGDGGPPGTLSRLDGPSRVVTTGVPDFTTFITDNGNGRVRAIGNDDDADGHADAFDNCKALANADQADADADGAGDACDGDLDGDGAANESDNCRSVVNAAQTDSDRDGIGDACDPTPLPAAPTAAPSVTGAALAPALNPPPAARVLKSPAKIRVLRAAVSGGVLDVLAEITARAAVTGARVTVTFRAAGRRVTFSAPIDNGGRIQIRRRLAAAQRGVRSGIFDLSFAGSNLVQPDTVRLRAASGRALLRLATADLTGGLLTVNGTVSRRARGVVQIRLGFDRPDGSNGFETFTARIARGKWSISQRLTGAAASGGQLSIQFTGFRAANLRGEQLAKAVG